MTIAFSRDSRPVHPVQSIQAHPVQSIQAHHLWQGGFTLVELTIVLLVIGLLLGGTLKGQSVVDNAKIKRMALDTAVFGNAIHTYRNLYHALPGDDPTASQRWNEVSDGNGNGVVDGSWVPGSVKEETSLLWSHLRSAQLLPGSGTDAELPRHPMGGRSGIGDKALKLSGLAYCMEDVPARFAIGYDAQFDDGQWLSGRIRGSSLMSLMGSLEGFDALEANVLLCVQLSI